MGAWGFGLFQSDHDMDIISELSYEAGVHKIHKKAAQKDDKDSDKAVHSGDEDSDDDDEEVYESIHAGEAENPALVREHLDSGVLDKMFAKYEAKLLAEEDKDDLFRDPGYMFMLIGACAMTLGCTISKKYKITMKKCYMCVGLPSDALKQLDKALNGPDGYKDGEPWDFASPGLMETMLADTPKKQTNAFGFVGMNVHGPGTMFYNPPKGSTKGLKELQAAKANESKYGNEVCGGCGATQREDGTALQACGTCKVLKYCSKKCQQQQWKFHQDVCAGMKKAAEEERGRGREGEGWRQEEGGWGGEGGREEEGHFWKEEYWQGEGGDVGYGFEAVTSGGFGR